MQSEFIYSKNEENINRYMNKAASWLRSIKLNEKLSDGRVLARELSVEEQKELMDYIYTLAYEEMKNSAGKHCIHKCSFCGYEDDFLNNFFEVIVKRLHTFNDGDSLKDGSKRYQFSTFLDSLSKEAIRITYAQIRGIPEFVEQRIQNVRVARAKVAQKKEIDSSKVTAEMIADELVRYMTVVEIQDLLNFMLEPESLDYMQEQDDGVEKAYTGTYSMESSLFAGLDYDIEKMFDAFFSRLTDVEKFFVLLQVGCDMTYYKMTNEQLSADELLVKIVEADKKFCKNEV